MIGKKLLGNLCLWIVFTTLTEGTESSNQTEELSPVYPGSDLPFTLELETIPLRIPGGLQGFAYAVQGEKVLCIAGRTNGVHGFEIGPENFPPNRQNTDIFVLNLKKMTVSSRSLYDPDSGFTQEQIDLLSVTAPEFLQVGNTLYLVGGYGVDTTKGGFGTKPFLSAIDVSKLIRWVEHPDDGKKASRYVRQVRNEFFQVTGGSLQQAAPHEPLLLIFGQNFQGYYTAESTGIYTEQVRTFRLTDDGNTLTPFDLSYGSARSSYRRRDLNVVPIITRTANKSYQTSFVALSGVFTVQSGIWTVPVFISGEGKAHMPNPDKSSTFKQSMNNYSSATVGLFSKKTGAMHTIVLGGISYQTCSIDGCTTDSEIPFTSNITDIVLRSNGKMKQYLFDTQYPVIYSNAFDPPRQLLFGANAAFILAPTAPLFSQKVLALDGIKKKTLIGYVAGGIMSSLPNTNDIADSTGSPYIFAVYLSPH